MNTRAKHVAFWTKALVMLALVSLAPTSRAGQRPIRLAVIVAKSSQLSGLSIHDIKRLYQGETVSSPAGGKLVPLAQPSSSPDRVGFDQAVLGMSPDEVARYWVDRRIRGHAGPPKSIESPALLQRVIARVNGAIGYVRTSQVQGDVKVLRIDGKLPEDGGYPIEY
jgi:hypothetical protein